MITIDDDWGKAQRFIAREALHLDARDWDAWLDLYHEKAEYLVPAWDDDGELTTDPQREISLIYYANRGGLEDRVFRIRTKRSSATMPAMRTCHQFTLLDVKPTDQGLAVRTNWSTHSFRENDITLYFGWAYYNLIPHNDDWKIMRKKTVVLNDVAKTMMDVYSI